MKSKIDRMRHDALEIFTHGIDAVKADRAVRNAVTLDGTILRCLTCNVEYDLSKYENIIIVGAGKATAWMAKALEDIAGEYISGGVINVKYGHSATLKRISINEAGHPVPDMNGETGAAQIAETAASASRDDLVICLLSGGGSALMPLPAHGITLEEKQLVTDIMLATGAEIHEINCIRKHISAIKGGRLAQMVYPATLLTLIISDVIGDDLSTIASGPTAPDETTFEDALNILDRYNLMEKIPVSVRQHIISGSNHEQPETASKDEPCFTKTTNCIIASNSHALEKAANHASELGYNTVIMTTSLTGEAREAAKFMVSIARETTEHKRPVKPPACLLFGGETTVSLK
jgi:hydroxypyruvate reductase